MARGKPRIKTISCCRCKEELPETDFYGTASMFFTDKTPACKKCIDKIYNVLRDKYITGGIENPEKQALYRVCQAYDIYFSNGIYKKAVDHYESNPNTSILAMYFKIVRTRAYGNKTFDDTLIDLNSNTGKIEIVDEAVSTETKKFFGVGFSTDDYKFLQKEYEDWTARHECETKAQEEVFKQICFAQLNILKAQRNGDETKDVVATFQKLLDTAKLQPKQNHSETMSNAQTFGTLIDKWENTRPLPEIDEELKDVDKIGLYVDAFFKGHTCKMLGVKNGYSNQYDRIMKNYTVTRPEYENEDDSDVMFDSIFGEVSD